MANEGPWRLLGAPGWGSAIVEALLVWCDVPYRFEDVSEFDRPGAARDRLLALNPAAQVPTVVLPDGVVMTESAAIALLLAELHPRAGLAPVVGDRLRPAFLRRLVWLVGAVYPTFTVADYPERYAPSATAELVGRVETIRQGFWRDCEAELMQGGWMLGETRSALDVFVAVMTRWRPRRGWFAAECPRLAAIAAKVDDFAELKPVWERNFPRSGRA